MELRDFAGKGGFEIGFERRPVRIEIGLLLIWV
jgi:hypothetical protein